MSTHGMTINPEAISRGNVKPLSMTTESFEAQPMSTESIKPQPMPGGMMMTPPFVTWHLIYGPPAMLAPAYVDQSATVEHLRSELQSLKSFVQDWAAVEDQRWFKYDRIRSYHGNKCRVSEDMISRSPDKRPRTGNDRIQQECSNNA